MLDEHGSCAGNPPELLGGDMASSFRRRRPLGLYRAVNRADRTEFTATRMPTSVHKELSWAIITLAPTRSNSGAKRH